MRVLCICVSGNVRSVTLGRILKKRGAEVLCCGVDKRFSSDTVSMLARWAEVIYVQRDAEEQLKRHIYRASSGDYDDEFAKIDLRFDVGHDDWKIPDHPLLLKRMRELVDADPQWNNGTGSD